MSATQEGVSFVRRLIALVLLPLILLAIIVVAIIAAVLLIVAMVIDVLQFIFLGTTGVVRGVIDGARGLLER